MEIKIVTISFKRQLDHVLLHEQQDNGVAINNNFKKSKGSIIYNT
jgi:hypothetical protein